MDKTLGQKIKTFRTQAGMSQLELELSIGAAQGSISRIESGKVNPTKETLARIIELLNLDGYQAASLFSLKPGDFAGILETSKKLNESLNIDVVIQRAVNEIAYDLNLLGVFICLRRGNQIFASKFTQTFFTVLASKILPKPFDQLNIPLNTKENYASKVILENRPYYTEHLADYSTPFISERTSNLLQKVCTLKSGIGFPITIADKTIGVIFYGKNHIDNFEQEYQVLEMFAEHVGVAISNARKYSALQKAIEGLNL